MASTNIYFLSFESMPLRATSNQVLHPNGLAKMWIQAKGPDEAIFCAQAHLVEYGLSPGRMEQPPIKTTAEDYSHSPIDLANFRKAEDFGVAMHLEAHDLDK
jgi:hypothetical protein